MTDGRNWKTLTRRGVFAEGPVRIAVESVELPDGRVIPDYYRVELPDYVLVYAEMEDGRVPLFRQYRHGPGHVCLTFPGGLIERDDTPLDAARRELAEELGCSARQWTSLGSFVTNANQSCNRAHLFKASGCTRVSHPHSDDLEDATLEYLSQEQLRSPGLLTEVALTSHALLLLLATSDVATATIDE